jgi:hypothetical protein
MLFVTLLAWGAFQRSLDVSMNTQAIAVQRAQRRALMPGFQAPGASERSRAPASGPWEWRSRSG